MQDPAFPQLQVALQPQRMRTLLQDSVDRDTLPDSVRIRIIACSVDEVRYKPGKRCMLSYRLTLDSAGQTEDRWVTAHLCRADVPAATVEEHASPTLQVDGGGMHLCWFPDDRRLPHLRKLLNTRSLADLPALAPERLGCKPLDRWQLAEPVVVHYLPEQSCVLRFALSGRSENGIPYPDKILYAKMYGDATGAATWQAMTQLNNVWPYGARALAFDAETNTLWQAQVPGQVLSWSRVIGKDGGDLLDNLAACVASLHAAPVTVAGTFDIEEIARLLTRTAALAGTALRGHALRISRVVDRLLSLRERAGQATSVSLLHRDLKLLNFLADGTRLHLIDIDTLAMGDALSDTASLVGNMYLYACRNGTHPVVAEVAVQRFVAAYVSHSAVAVCEWRSHWHIAAALIYEVIRRGLRQMDVSRLAQLETIVAISERYCAAL